MQRIFQVVLGVLLAMAILYWLAEAQVFEETPSSDESVEEESIPDAVPLSPPSPTPQTTATPSPAATTRPTPTPSPTPIPTPATDSDDPIPALW
ncbi:hypothetical protein AY600_06015 [Phormidium willei BDU 130791]|nr:hypothetical protein AY600_06015 [Phormidium willei BDU 130791]